MGDMKMTYTVAGHVRDAATGQTLDGIRVELQRDGMTIMSAITRNNGGFEFDSISSGRYTLEVNADGYAPASVDADVTDAPFYGAVIDLRKGAGNSSAGALTAHESSIPSKARDAYDKGVSLLHTNPDFKAAIVQFERAIQIFPDYYEAYEIEGVCYFSLGDTTSAEKAARKSAELSSGKYSQALFLLASILNRENQFAEAGATARQAVVLDATAWQGHFELGRALSALNRPQEAEPEAIRARDLHPANPRVFLLLANIHGQLHNDAALLEDLNGYLKIGPPGPMTDAVRKNRDQLQKNVQDAQAQPQPQAQPAKP